MTNKLAILLLRNIKIYHKGMSQREIQITKEALDMAIKALEKSSKMIDKEEIT